MNLQNKLNNSFRLSFFSLILTLVLFSIIDPSFADDYKDNQPSGEKIFDCDCIAFRLDDVQDHFLNQPVKKLIETFKDRELPLTIAILSNEFDHDEELVDLIKDLTNNQESQFEISSIGTTHEDFTKLSNEEQKTKMMESVENIKKTLGVSIKVFIPPYGAFNDGTVVAMKESGITHFSPSFIPGNEVIVPYKEENFFQLPSGSFTGEVTNHSDFFTGVPASRTFSQINNDIQNYGYSIVTMHPMEYGLIKEGKIVNEINQQQFDELDKLLDEIEKSGFQIVNIQDITKISSNQNESDSIPKWIKNIFIWYGQDKIGEDDLKNALQFLIKEKILIID